MNHVSERPTHANADRLSTDPSSPLAALSWDDPAEVQTLLGHLREHVLDLAGVAEDAARPKKKRLRSRAEAKRGIRGAKDTLLALLAHAERGAPLLSPSH
jgi:hypothetical protein